MTLKFFISVLLFGLCGLNHVLGFPLQEDDDADDITTSQESWPQDEGTREKTIWLNSDEADAIKREWIMENLPNSLYKRLWNNYENYEHKNNIKRLWRSQENTSDADTLCVTCSETRCKRSSDKMRPNGGKTLPCCNC